MECLSDVGNVFKTIFNFFGKGGGQRFLENIALQENLIRCSIYIIDAPKNLLLLFHQTKLESLRRETTIKLYSASVFNSNKSPTRCNRFPVYYPDAYLQLNVFRTFSRPSSGAQ
jgi:hypothetical protein